MPVSVLTSRADLPDMRAGVPMEMAQRGEA
jgi:hypothetical protein